MAAAHPRRRRGTPKLSEAARHVILPKGITSTGWPAVRDKGLELGLRFDQWQDGAGRAILAKRADGKYAATVGGVTMSIPRQTGKTYLIGMRSCSPVRFCPGFDGAVDCSPAEDGQRDVPSMQGMAKRRKIAPHVEQVFTGSGEEAILFRNGSRILFGARETGFGRGFAKVDIEVFDEAQILTERALDDMLPAMNASPNALAIFAGTPPTAVGPGRSVHADAFGRARDRVRQGRRPVDRVRARTRMRLRMIRAAGEGEPVVSAQDAS
jgi:hypothetical protein